MMNYEFTDDVAIADVEFRAWGSELDQVFTAAAEATMNVMIQDLDTIQPKERRDIALENDAIDMLLFDFLQELVYYKDSENLILRIENADIQEHQNRYELRAIASGETLDPERHEQGVDVKAVTLHRFSLEQTENGWQANVILDI